jgi:hypothetical protein
VAGEYGMPLEELEVRIQHSLRMSGRVKRRKKFMIVIVIHSYR